MVSPWVGKPAAVGKGGDVGFFRFVHPGAGPHISHYIEAQLWVKMRRATFGQTVSSHSPSVFIPSDPWLCVFFGLNFPGFM